MIALVAAVLQGHCPLVDRAMTEGERISLINRGASRRPLIPLTSQSEKRQQKAASFPSFWGRMGTRFRSEEDFVAEEQLVAARNRAVQQDIHVVS